MVVMKSSIFWDITLCSPFKVIQRFLGTRRLHLQVERKAKQETSMMNVTIKSWLLLLRNVG
jgi:hypothetical protein